MLTENDMADKIAEALASGEMDADSLVEALSEMVDPEAEKREAENRKMRVNALGVRLYSLAQEQVQQRQQTEERWYKDVRQFNGQYDPGTFDTDAYGSKVYVPLTRRLVGLVEARLFDMLFPSDERSYVIEPTPVPDLDQAVQLAEQLPPEAMVQMPEGPVPAGAIKETVASIMEEAKKRCGGMQREIDDQLAECAYPQHARDVIHDAVLYGTGVIKGPVPMFRTTKRWTQDESGTFVLSMERKPVPEVARVDLWNFFPDMSATHLREAEYVFERHYLTKQQLADLQDMPDVDVEALRSMIEVDPTTPTNNYRERLRAINGASGAKDKRYEVWEYHGPIDADDLMACGCDIEADPLKTYTGVVWFGSGGVVLKAALNPLDTNDHPYSVFTWQQDESSIFGFGIPYEVRDAQEAANSSFRAMLDNMGLCVLPQVIVDDAAIEPMNLAWGLEPGKFWRNKRPGSDARQSMQFVEINARFPELQGVFQMSKGLIEEVGTLPAFLQGTEAPNYMQSATGASIAYNAANLWVRRVVRNWDDDIVTPVIGRFFDWNMQYSEKEEIKGDSKVRAMGITALVELEGQAQRLTQFMQVSSQMGLPPSNQMAIMREFARAFKLDPDRVLPTEAEIEQMKKAEAANGGQQQNPEMLKLQLAREQMQTTMQIEQAKMQLRREEIAANQAVMQQRMQLEIADTAAKEQITQQEAMRKYGYDLQKTQAELADRQADRDHKAQMLNAEMQLKAQLGSGI